MKPVDKWVEGIYKRKEFLFPYKHPVVKFPLYMDIEPTNYCNMDCLMCSRQKMTRELGFMSLDTLDAILDQSSEFKPGIRFVGWGEPLLHPELEEFIKRVKARNILLLISTNGLLLNEKNREIILKNHVDTVRISFQGVTKEGYSFMRNNDKYDEILKNITSLMEERNNGEYDTFVIMNTTITNETREEIEDFRNYWEKIVDKAEIGKTTFSHVDDVERVKELKLLGSERIKRVYRPCVDVRIKLQVNWNGDVTACCSDHSNELILGNVKKDPIADLWNGKMMNELRDILGEKREHYKIPVCEECYWEETKFDGLKEEYGG